MAMDFPERSRVAEIEEGNRFTGDGAAMQPAPVAEPPGA
jgi:hypothetical protein